MSILDKVGNAALDTMSTISTKSTEVIEIGKLKLKINQLDDKITNKKKEIGVLVYDAYSKEEEPARDTVMKLVSEIKGFEKEIQDNKEKIAAIQQKQ